MSPNDALQMQIERYRGMTPGERLRLALEMHDMVCQVSRAGIKQRYPHASPAEIEQELSHRLSMPPT